MRQRNRALLWGANTPNGPSTISYCGPAPSTALREFAPLLVPFALLWQKRCQTDLGDRPQPANAAEMAVDSFWLLPLYLQGTNSIFDEGCSGRSGQSWYLVLGLRVDYGRSRL